ncbi:MAG: hypothetical protein RL513_1801 [Pseudomonadota bacterium]|jgi:hypothetical protein
MDATDAQVVDDTRRWLERAVIGLNLCPFAKAVHVKGQVHYAVSAATGWNELLADLAHELDALLAHDAGVRETTLLMAPRTLADFFEFTGFLAEADRLLQQRGLEGTIQLASFHPHYQFAGTGVDDITNFTNRAPYPTLHLLREDSIERAVQSFPDAADIYETNMATLRRLGPQGWAAVMKATP